LHDYNLWMVPATLRYLRPDLKIAFFHHTHFPAGDIFNIIPWRQEIIASLLACDYIGFHIPRHAENFVDAARGNMPISVKARSACAPRYLTFGCAMGVETMVTELQAGERVVRLGAHPIGTDVGRIRDCLACDTVQADMQRIRNEIGNRRLVLSVERLDYGKGILEKLHAFERLLEADPALHGEVTLVTVCVPAAKEMTIYRSLQTQIDQTVGRINGRFSRMDWTPVRFFSRALPFEQVVAHYAVADVMWITPLRDGMNLVAKEYVACRYDEKGALVLSEFAGAASELKSAYQVNPHDINGMKQMLLAAINADPRENARRMNAMRRQVMENDIDLWAANFLRELNSVRDPHAKKTRPV